MKILKFGAEWCGPCKTMDKRLSTFTTCPVEYINVDDDENETLVTEYNIRNIPVIVLLNDNNKEIKRWVGAIQLSEIDAAIAES